MSIQRHPDGRRSVRVEVEVPGTPEQVWQAIASGPGVSAWFVPSQTDGRKGGTFTNDFGQGMVSVATITDWQAPVRFAAESPGWAPGMPTMATEWTVEAKSGGTCVVRVVHSLFASTDDWDGQLEGTEHGWPTYFRVLRRYLENFAGQRSAQIQASVVNAMAVDDVWSRLAKDFGLAEAKPGARFAVAIAPDLKLAGVVERLDPKPGHMSALVHLEQPLPGTMMVGAYACGGAMASLQAFLYGPRAVDVAATAGPVVQQWLAARLGAS